jgi:hypothetical protein
VGRARRVSIAGVLLAMVGVLLPATAAHADGVQTAWFTNAGYNTSNGGWIDAVTAGDLNGDGRNDVAVSTDYAGGNLEVFYQNATGGLKPPVVVDAAGPMVRIADVTGDGRADLVNFTATGLNVRAQLVNGTLAAATAITIASTTGMGEVGDFNGDTRLDVAIARGDNTVALLQQQANGSLAAPVTLATYPSVPRQVRLTDVNGDSRADLAVAYGDSTVSFRTQTPGGTLNAATTVASPSVIRDFVLGDFNDDTFVDIAMSHGHNGNSYVVYRNPDLTWGPAVGLTEPNNAVYYTAVRTGDIDHDGKLDLVLVKSHNDTYVYLQGPDGLALEPIAPGHSVMQWPSAQNGWVADINGDGYDDILSAAYYGPLSVSYNTTGTTVSGIIGDVTDTTDAPLSGITVDAFDGNGALAATTTTNGLGHYYFSWRVLDPTASYTLRFTDPSGTRPTVWYGTTVPAADEHGAALVSYELGSATTADVTIPLAATASGRVVDGHQVGIADLTIEIGRSSGFGTSGADAVVSGVGSPYAVATTDADGRFELPGLLPGDYWFSIDDNNGAYQTEWWGRPGEVQGGVAPSVTVSAPATDIGTHTVGVTACSETIPPGSNQEGAVLTGCRFDGRNLGGVNFTGADLAGSRFRSTNLAGADLDGVDVSHSDLFLARLVPSSRTGVIYDDTTCPDGTSSDDHGDTCQGHLANPIGSDDPLGELFDVTAEGRVTGWGLDPNTIDPVDVRVTIDGSSQFAFHADLPSVEAEAAHPLYGADHGFDGMLGGLLTPGIHEICLDVENVGPGADTRLGCRVIDSPVNDARYLALAPARILDTRNGTGTGGDTDPIGPNGFIDLDVTGVGGVPVDHVGAVVLNVTVTDPSQPSFLTVWPSQTSKPVASNLNFVPWQTVPNLVVAKVGANGKVRIGNLAGTVNVVADVAGFFDDGDIGGGAYHPTEPVRLLDTRIGTGGTTGPLGPGEVAHLQVGGSNGVPLGGASAVVMNVTVTDTTAPSYLTVFPTGTPRPLASNLNFTGGQTVANLVVVKVSPDGWVDFANTFGDVNVIADLAGWFDTGTGPGATYNPLSPSRILDTRTGNGSAPQPIPEGGTIHVRAAGVGGVPVGASAVVLNLTVTNPSAMTFLTAFPSGTDRPVASNINVLPWQTVPNLVVVKVSPEGWIDLFNAAGTVDVVADVQGYFV